MIHEPPTLEVYINKIALRTFAKSYYKQFVDGIGLVGNEKVLDYGSGAGGPARAVAKKLIKSGGMLTCVDASKKWIDCIQSTLKKYDNVEIKYGTLSEVKLADNMYDKIIIHFVLHEIPVELRKSIVATLVKKLKVNGEVIIREPQCEIQDTEVIQLFQAVGVKNIYNRTIKIPMQGNAYDMRFKK